MKAQGWLRRFESAVSMKDERMVPRSRFHSVLERAQRDVEQRREQQEEQQEQQERLQYQEKERRPKSATVVLDGRVDGQIRRIKPGPSKNKSQTGTGSGKAGKRGGTGSRRSTSRNHSDKENVPVVVVSGEGERGPSEEEVARTGVAGVVTVTEEETALIESQLRRDDEDLDSMAAELAAVRLCRLQGVDQQHGNENTQNGSIVGGGGDGAGKRATTVTSLCSRRARLADEAAHFQQGVEAGNSIASQLLEADSYMELAGTSTVSGQVTAFESAFHYISSAGGGGSAYGSAYGSGYGGGVGVAPPSQREVFPAQSPFERMVLGGGGSSVGAAPSSSAAAAGGPARAHSAAARRANAGVPTSRQAQLAAGMESVLSGSSSLQGLKDRPFSAGAVRPRVSDTVPSSSSSSSSLRPAAAPSSHVPGPRPKSGSVVGSRMGSRVLTSQPPSHFLCLQSSNASLAAGGSIATAATATGAVDMYTNAAPSRPEVSGVAPAPRGERDSVVPVHPPTRTAVPRVRISAKMLVAPGPGERPTADQLLMMREVKERKDLDKRRKLALRRLRRGLQYQQQQASSSAALHVDAAPSLFAGDEAYEAGLRAGGHADLEGTDAGVEGMGGSSVLLGTGAGAGAGTGLNPMGSLGNVGVGGGSSSWADDGGAGEGWGEASHATTTGMGCGGHLAGLRDPAIQLVAQSEAQWGRAIHDVREAGHSLLYQQLSSLSRVSEPPPYATALLRYVACLMGTKGAHRGPYAAMRERIFKSVRDLLKFLRQVDPMLLPLQRVRRARAIAMRDLPLDMGPADHWRCPGARELLRWVLAMQAALQLRSLCKQIATNPLVAGSSSAAALWDQTGSVGSMVSFNPHPHQHQQSEMHGHGHDYGYGYVGEGMSGAVLAGVGVGAEGMGGDGGGFTEPEHWQGYREGGPWHPAFNSRAKGGVANAGGGRRRPLSSPARSKGAAMTPQGGPGGAGRAEHDPSSSSALTMRQRGAERPQSSVGRLQVVGAPSAVAGAGGSVEVGAGSGGPRRQSSTDEEYEDVFEDDDGGYEDDFD